MDAGRIAQAGTPKTLYETPCSEFVAGFMGEAMLFTAQSLPDGQVQLGPLRFAPRHRLPAGPVKVAVRPEAWRIEATQGAGLSGRIIKCAYLGSLLELTIDTELGPLFVVSPDVERAWKAGETLSLALAGHGLSVVAA